MKGVTPSAWQKASHRPRQPRRQLQREALAPERPARGPCLVQGQLQGRSRTAELLSPIGELRLQPGSGGRFSSPPGEIHVPQEQGRELGPGSRGERG